MDGITPEYGATDRRLKNIDVVKNLLYFALKKDRAQARKTLRTIHIYDRQAFGPQCAGTETQGLRMEFKTFLNAFILLPCQLVRTGRRIVFRLMAWNPWLSVLFRAVDVLRRPLRADPQRLG